MSSSRMGAEPDALAHRGEIALRAVMSASWYPRRNLHGGPAGISTAERINQARLRPRFWRRPPHGRRARCLVGC